MPHVASFVVAFGIGCGSLALLAWNVRVGADDTPVMVAASPQAGGHIHPSICRAKDGTLIVVYKGPQVLMRARSTDGGKTWEQPEAIATSAKRPDVIRAVKIFEVYPGTADTLPDGRLVVTWNYIADDKAKDGYYERALLYSLSGDQGRTWSEQQLIGPVDGKHLGAVRHNVLPWSGGRWLLPLRVGPPRLFDSKNNELAVFPVKGPDDRQHAFQQIVRTAKGTLLAMGPVFLRSTDEGRTWASIANFPAFPDGDSAEGRYLTTLSDGRVLVTWGVGTANKGLRYNFSADDGQTWNTNHTVTLLPDANIAARYYSARTIQVDDQHIGTAYLSGSVVYFLKVRLDRVAASDPLAEWTAKAEKGDPTAQYELARRYAGGQGVAKDEAKALAWFRKAAAQGHTPAEVSLGSIYAHGFGVPQDWAESIRWYRLAASKGDTTAQHNLGLDYAHGHGVDLDPRQGASWFRKAAEQGHARAQFNLGELYEAGKGVPQSDLEAFVLYTLAGEHENQEHIFGKAKAAEVIAKRARTEKKLSTEQREQAMRRIATARALAAVHPRKFGAPGLIGKSRGWFVWKKWNPDTWEAEVTQDPPGEVFKVHVLPWATTYRHLSYAASFDDLLPGEKMNMFFDPDANHRRGYVVHFQDEISQMKGHGHAWKILEVNGAASFVAQIFAGDKPLEQKAHAFAIDPACGKWLDGKLVEKFPMQPGDRVFMTWVYRDKSRVAMLLTDDASLETLKKLETHRIDKRITAEGMSGRLETVDKAQAQFMIYSNFWAQANRLKPGQVVHITATGPGYRPTEARVEAKVVSQQNRGLYGSGVNDVMVQLLRGEDADWLQGREDQVLRLIPGK